MTLSATFRELSDRESRALLRRNHVGRLCFLNGRAVDVEPVHYVVDRSWIYFRSAHGVKLEALAHVPYAAFEVDEIDGLFEWRSVVVKGTVYERNRSGSPSQRRGFDRALRALRTLIPLTFRRGDPTPFRDTVVGLYLAEVTGRMATQVRKG